MKIKDIVREGFWTSLLPSALGKAIDAGKRSYTPSNTAVASQAQKMFGDNPESEFPGSTGWLDTATQEQIKAQIKAYQDAQEEIKKQNERQKKVRKGMQNVLTGPLPPSVPAATQPPPQVKLPSGQYVTKYGNAWYDEQGQRIAIPGDIERLERMARGPSGQAQMAGTKNVPVDLPKYKGKRR